VGSGVARFLDYKRAEGLAEQTQSDYTRHGFIRKYPSAWSTADRLADAAFKYLAEDKRIALVRRSEKADVQ